MSLRDSVATGAEGSAGRHEGGIDGAVDVRQAGSTS
jgi:hypothetical protein